MQHTMLDTEGCGKKTIVVVRVTVIVEIRLLVAIHHFLPNAHPEHNPPYLALLVACCNMDNTYTCNTQCKNTRTQNPHHTQQSHLPTIPNSHIHIPTMHKTKQKPIISNTCKYHMKLPHANTIMQH
jgi:hypothetical protein